MKTINTLGILIACFSLLASGCGGDDGSDTHIKIEAYWGLSVSHPSFKTIPEAVSYINSLGVKTYHIKCGRLGPFNDTGEGPRYYIEFEIDSFNITKTTASGEFYLVNSLSIRRAEDIPCS